MDILSFQQASSAVSCIIKRKSKNNQKRRSNYQKRKSNESKNLRESKTLQAATMEKEEPSTPTNALQDLENLYLSSPDSPKKEPSAPTNALQDLGNLYLSSPDSPPKEEPSTPINALLDPQKLSLSSPDSPKESAPLATWEALEIELASFKKKFKARVAASEKDREALEIELAKSQKETAFKDGQLEYMMDLYMKQSVGEKETDSVSEEIDLLEFLGASNDIELGASNDIEMGVLDDGELADSLTDSDDEQNE